MEITRPTSPQPIPEHARCVFQGTFFSVYQWEQPLFDGTSVTFEKVKRKDTAVIIPVTPEGTILITHEEQPGKKPFISLAGGQIETNEDPLTAASRELLEETGYRAERFELLDAVQPISKVEWAIYTFVAKGCVKVQEQQLDAGEKIQLQEISFDDFLELASRDDFHETSIAFKVLRARLDPAKMQELKELLGPE